jgi:exonuclease VII large subunit
MNESEQRRAASDVTRTVTSAQPSLPVSSLEVALQGGASRQEILGFIRILLAAIP